MKIKTLYTASIVYFIYSFTSAMTVPFYGPYLHTRGYSDSFISLLFAIFPFLVFLTLPYFGKLADCYGKKYVIYWGIFLEMISLLFFTIDSHWSFIFLARIFNALSTIAPSLLLATIEENISEKHRGKSTGWVMTISSVAAIISPLAGAFLMNKYRVDAPFLASALVLYLCCFFFFFEKGKKERHFCSFVWLSEVKSFFAHKEFIGVIIVGNTMHAFSAVTALFVPLLITEHNGWSYTLVGTMMLGWGIAHFFQRWLGDFADKIGYEWSILLGTSTSAAFLMFLPFVHNKVLFGIVFFLCGVCASLWNVSAWALLSRVGKREKKEGEVISNYLALCQMGALMSYLINAFFVHWLRVEIVFLTTGLLVLIGNVFAYRFLFKKN